MPITQIIFDCDGVLIDSELLIAEVESALRTKLGLPITTEEYLKKYVGLSTRSREYTDDLAKLPADYHKRVGERVRKAMHDNLRALPACGAFSIS
jgi:beta-phosphoglucomutase-like phosphatase (HAD superfamily)